VTFDPLDIAVRLSGRKTEVQVWLATDSRRPVSRFRLPWASEETASLLASIERQVHASILSASGAPPPPAPGSSTLGPRELGEALFGALFDGEVDRLLDSQLAQLAVGEPDGGLRLRLCFDDQLADVAALPWELLLHPRRQEFLGRSPRTPVSRFLPGKTEVNRTRFQPPLKVLLVGPCPAELEQLDLAAEREYLYQGLSAYSGVEVLEVQPATFERLAEILARETGIHILHFMGHGGFVPSSGQGALLFEGPARERRVVPGEVFAEHLRGCPSLRLVVLNCCQSGQVPRQRGQDPFAGKFYSSLAVGDPVDVATARGRLAIYGHAPHSLEWITPVLFLQVPDGQIFERDASPGPTPEPQPVAEPAWVTALARRLDDGSLQRVRRRLERLGRLFALPSLLSPEEGAVLRAAACLRLWVGESGLGGDPGGPPDLAAAAAHCAASAEPGADLTDPSLQTGPWRLDLLAALLRLSEILDLDRTAMPAAGGGRMPDTAADVTEWVAYLTREIRLQRGGIVQFVLEAPSPEWIDPLKRSTALHLEATWQELRATLLPAGLIVAAAPSEIVLGKIRPPAGVLERLRQFGDKVGKALPRLANMGTSWKLPLEILLPLPGSAVRGEEALATSGEFPGFLTVEEEESGLQVYRRPIAWDERSVVLDLEGLRPERWYRWQLYTEEIAGDFRLVRLGRLRPLSAEERQRLSATSGPPSRYDLLALQLHGDLLRELAPALEAGTAALEEAALVHRLIVEAHDWVSREAPRCTLADAYRNSAIWLATQLFPGGTLP
jgi:hypothetical protein